jgi:polyisoprenoid-binding protein YceI
MLESSLKSLRTPRNLAVAAILLSSLSAFADKMPAHQAGTYEIDPAHTRVQFKTPHFVISEVEGRFNEVSGKITLAPEWKDAKFEATVQTQSVDTAVAKRDEHLRSADFFDVTKHPTMTFKSTKVTVDGDDLKVTGDLMIKGIKKKVTFDVDYEGSLNDPWGNHRVAFKGETKINRRDFKINYGDKGDKNPTVGDQVEIELIVQATKPLPKQ